MTIRQLFGASALLVAVTSAASAQDFTGMLGLTAGGSLSHMTNSLDDLWWYEGDARRFFGNASVSVGVVVAPDVRLQVGGWTRALTYSEAGMSQDGPESQEFDEQQFGIGGHLTYRPGEMLVGVGGNLSAHTDLANSSEVQSSWGTVALDIGYEADDFSVIGQIGTIHRLDQGRSLTYGSVAGTYYLNPDLSLGAHALAGVTGGYQTGVALRLGMDVRYKLEDAPLILSGGYEYAHWQSSVTNYIEDTHRIRVGLHIPLGDAGTLRDIDRTVAPELASYF